MHLPWINPFVHNDTEQPLEDAEKPTHYFQNQYKKKGFKHLLCLSLRTITWY